MLVYYLDRVFFFFVPHKRSNILVRGALKDNFQHFSLECANWMIFNLVIQFEVSGGSNLKTNIYATWIIITLVERIASIFD